MDDMKFEIEKDETNQQYNVRVSQFMRPMGVVDLVQQINPNNFKGLAELVGADQEESWGDRDSLPTGDPIGDVVEEPQNAQKYPTKFIRDQALYHKQLRERGFDNANKFYGDSKPEGCCDNPDKYKNIVSNSLKFYACKNCGADLGDIND